MSKRSVLILCTGNSARSQMGEGLLRHMASDRFEVASAGTKPSIVRPEAIQAMQEIGISLEGHRSKSVDEFVGKPIDYVITVCDNAKESCPIFPAQTSRMHWPFQDPPGPNEQTYEERLAVFRTSATRCASASRMKSSPVLLRPLCRGQRRASEEARSFDPPLQQRGQ